MCQWNGSALVQIMACRLVGARPLPEATLNKLQRNMKQNTKLSFREIHLKMSFVKWRPFFSGEMSSVVRSAMWSLTLDMPNHKLPWNKCTHMKHTPIHDDVIKWKHFPRYWSFVRGIHRSPVNSPHKGQWRGALMFSLIYAWINGWINNREAGDLRRHRAHYDVLVM